MDFTVYLVPNSYVTNGGTVNVNGVYTMTIDDDDLFLNAGAGSDPGSGQNITIAGQTVRRYEFIYDDNITWTPAGGGPAQTTAVITFEARIGRTTYSFIMSDSDTEIPGMTTGATITLGSFTSYTPNEYTDFVPCFCTGTLIRTEAGLRPVETLVPGDRVWTADKGFRRILWAGCTTLTGREILSDTRRAPIRIAKGAAGGGAPWRDLWVSPQHRILVQGWEVSLVAGELEAFVPARHLVDGRGITVEHGVSCVTYHHVLLPEHAIVEAEGLLSESFYLGDTATAGLSRTTLADIRSSLGSTRKWETLGSEPTARPVLTRAEAGLLSPAAIAAVTRAADVTRALQTA